MENQSLFDPSRKTVGAMYRDLQMGSHDESVTNGDLTNELMSSLVCDINDAIDLGNKEFEGRKFYILIQEKKDLAMPHMINRRVIKSEKRFWPEDDTIVFLVIPQSNEVKFCWCLPHSSEMPNMLNSEYLYDADMIDKIKSYYALDLYNFGFRKDEMGNWEENPLYKGDKLMAEYKIKILIPS